MTVKSLARLAACTLTAGLAFVAQNASCLPFWDSGTEYPLVGTPPTNNLGALTNVEGNVWGRCYGNTNSPTCVDVEVLNYPMTVPGLECSDVNSFLFGFAGTNSFTDRIAIHPAVNGTVYQATNGPIYYSFIFTVPTIGGDTTGGFICGFNNTVGPQAANPTVVGARIYVIPNGAGYQIGIGKQPSNAAATNVSYVSTVLSFLSTNFVVCSYGFGTNPCKMWLNPSPSTFGAVTPPAPDATNNNGGDVSSVESFEFRQGNALIPEVYAADLRIGFCWACVTPPASGSAPQADSLTITKSSTNRDVISFATNSPCFLLSTTTSLPSATNAWKPIATDGTPITAGNFVVTNTVPNVTAITTNVNGNSTNYTTNISVGDSYYQAKTYSN